MGEEIEDWIECLHSVKVTECFPVFPGKDQCGIFHRIWIWVEIGRIVLWFYRRDIRSRDLAVENSCSKMKIKGMKRHEKSWQNDNLSMYVEQKEWTKERGRTYQTVLILPFQSTFANHLCFLMSSASCFKHPNRFVRSAFSRPLIRLFEFFSNSFGKSIRPVKIFW